jgi:hypothetical protein
MKSVIIAPAAITLLLAGCGTSNPTTGGHTLHVRFVLHATPYNIGGATQRDCIGLHGFEDFRSGISVTVKDGNGAVIGVGSLDNDPTASADLVGLKQCPLVGDITVKNAEFYVVTAGNRGDTTRSAADMKASNYAVELSLSAQP